MYVRRPKGPESKGKRKEREQEDEDEWTTLPRDARCKPCKNAGADCKIGRAHV